MRKDLQKTMKTIQVGNVSKAIRLALNARDTRWQQQSFKVQ